MTTLAIVADLHLNSKLALFPPTFKDNDGMMHCQNKIQEWLWASWLDYWQEVKRLSDGDLWLIINGDLFEGFHHGLIQIVSLNVADQQAILEPVFKPALDLKPTRAFIIRGTMAHGGQAGQFEEIAAAWLAGKIKVEQEPETGAYSWWYLPLEAGGVKFDIAHHGRGGYRPWTAHNAANNMAAELVFDYYNSEWKPDVAIRSHVHYRSDTDDNFPIRVIYTLPWQQSTAYGHKIKPGQRKMQAGGLIINCRDGQYEVTPKKYSPPLQEVWREPDGSDTRGIITGITKNIKRVWRAGRGDDLG